MSWWTDKSEGFHERAQVVIVGAGAGGSVAAVTLAEAGIDVLVLEEGFHQFPHTFPTGQSQAMSRFWQEGGMRTTNGTPPTPLPGGRGLGGSTLVNSAICFRTPEAVLDEWNHLSGGTFSDPEEFYLTQDEVEGVLLVNTTPDALLSPNCASHKEAANRLGWSNHNFRRNTPACAGCGRCNTGCSIGGKWSVDKAFLPRAAAAGARIYTGCKVTRLSQGRVVGYVVDQDNNELSRFSVDAENIILAGGSISTPRLVLDNRLPAAGPVGEGLHIHPAAGASAMTDRDIWGPGATQGHYVDHFLEDDTLLESIIMPAGVFTTTLPLTGRELRRVMPRIKNMAITGAQIRDRSEGMVLRSRGAGARIRWVLGEEDRLRLIRGIRRSAQLWLEGLGAEWVALSVYGSGICRSMDEVRAATPLDLPAGRIVTYASHPQCTMALGRVTDVDGQVKGVPGLYAMDASVLPTPVGRNPQISIMTVNRLLSARLARRLGGEVAPLWLGGGPPRRVPQPGALSELGGAPPPQIGRLDVIQ